MGIKLLRDYYLSEDVVSLAHDLLGKVLFTNEKGRISAGLITETEAYAGIIDRASHAYGDRRTARTSVMYRDGGVAYIYICYGMHSLFNVVTAPSGTPHAILIRAIRPVDGEDIMLQRLGKPIWRKDLTNGPGKVSRALGLHYSMSGEDLTGSRIWIEDCGIRPALAETTATPRIGVGYAGEDAFLPYRFCWQG